MLFELKQNNLFVDIYYYDKYTCSVLNMGVLHIGHILLSFWIIIVHVSHIQI